MEKAGFVSGIDNIGNMTLSSGKSRRMSESFIRGRNLTASPDSSRLSFRSRSRRNSVHRQFSLKLNRNKVSFTWVSFMHSIDHIHYFRSMFNYVLGS